MAEFDMFNMGGSPSMFDDVLKRKFASSAYSSPSTIDAWGTPNTLGGSTQLLDGMAGGAPEGYINPTGGLSSDSWFDMKGKGGMAIGGANVALGAFNSWMGMKNQKFMENYYGKQQAMQMADYSNNARSANESLSRNFSEGLNARGISASSAEGQQQSADYMNKWGAKETI